MNATATDTPLTAKAAEARQRLDEWTREMMEWHFNPDTGAPFWLERAKTFNFDPRKDVKSYDDLDLFGNFEDEWLRGGPVRRWVPKGIADKPIFVFETGGSTGVPKSRIAYEDFRIDYELFSDTLPDAAFPKGANWISVGPTGPRRLRLAVEHLAQHRGGICFHVDLDPRWVIKLIKMGEMKMMETYKQHVVDQALTLLRAHDIECLFTTPKLLEAMCEKVSLKKLGIKGIFCGGTEMTPQFHRFAVEELLDDIYFAPTYGNTMMGLAVHKPRLKEDNWAIIYYPPAPRAMVEVVDFHDTNKLVGYGETGRVRLTTLTREFFMPRFLERDEASVKPPSRSIRGMACATCARSADLARPWWKEFTDASHPILRRGQPYRSIDVARTNHFVTGEPFVEMSQANVGLIRRDLLQQAESRAALAQYATADLITMCRRAAKHFMSRRAAARRHHAVAAGLHRAALHDDRFAAHARAPQHDAVFSAMAEMDQVIKGLTRDLDFAALDRGYTNGEPALSFFPRGNTLGVVLPNNSPGVHSLWIPAIALKTALVLRPGSAEPWTPFRIIQALIKAGVPAEAFHFYPSDHAAGGEILRTCSRGMVFGDASTMRIYANDPRIEIHGPGFSKLVLGEDEADNWEQYLDVMARSIAENSGRSCVNASGVWTPRHGRKIAEALAERLKSIAPRAADDPEAALSPFVDPNVAERISSIIDDGLTEPGAVDMMNRERLVRFNGATYLLPTIVHCESPDHTIANREYLFPFASVVECPHANLVERIGPTLVVTALTQDQKIKRDLLTSPHVGRLNFGAIPTNHISWDQPHEGNLFDHLYARRAFQAA